VSKALGNSSTFFLKSMVVYDVCVFSSIFFVTRCRATSALFFFSRDYLDVQGLDLLGSASV